MWWHVAIPAGTLSEAFHIKAQNTDAQSEGREDLCFLSGWDHHGCKAQDLEAGGKHFAY